MQVLLVSVFSVFVSGRYVFWEINRFLKSFRVANIKIAGFSKLKTRVSLQCFEMKHASGLETCTKIYFLFIFNLV